MTTNRQTSEGNVLGGADTPRPKMPKEKQAFQHFAQKIADEYGLEIIFEYRFHPVRRWQFDVAYPQIRVALEYDGIMFRTVGHNSLGSMMKEHERYNEAQALGWRVFRCNAKSIADKSFIEFVRRFMAIEMEAEGES